DPGGERRDARDPGPKGCFTVARLDNGLRSVYIGRSVVTRVAADATRRLHYRPSGAAEGPRPSSAATRPRDAGPERGGLADEPRARPATWRRPRPSAFPRPDASARRPDRSGRRREGS